MPHRHVWLFITAALLVTGCTLTQQTPAAFALYSGNQSLPPEYQRITTIRGTIHSTRIDLVYSYRDANGKLECPLTVEGERFQRYVEIVHNTRLKVEPVAVGGGSFDVTFTDAEGNRRTGNPSNKDAWTMMAADVGAQACQSDKAQ